MKLSNKKLQELKNGAILIKDLYEKYFYTEKSGVNIENILKLLTNDVCSFQEIVGRFKTFKRIIDRLIIGRFKTVEYHNLYRLLSAKNNLS